MKTYQGDDYVFVDSNGVEYISTPQIDIMPTIGMICAVWAIMMLCLFGTGIYFA